MGMADDAVDGLCCSVCGTYFRKAHGYPVMCKSCWDDCTPDEREQSALQKAREREV